MGQAWWHGEGLSSEPAGEGVQNLGTCGMPRPRLARQLAESQPGEGLPELLAGGSRSGELGQDSVRPSS